MIDRQLKDCSIFLYPTVEAANAGLGWGGSGFLLGFPGTPDAAKVHLYAVTNDHVRLTCPVIRYGDGEPVDGDADDWIPHPDGDDLAIKPLGFLPARGWAYVDAGLILTDLQVITWQIGPGDDCLMVGRFIAGDGQQRTQPVVRFGNLSALPEAVYQPLRGFDQWSFLVEMRSLSGFSGSPVFLYFVKPGVMSMLIPARPDTVIGERSIMDKRWLLGVDWGHLPTTEDILDKNRKPLPDGWKLSVNSGMACVVPAWKLRDILQMEELVSSRKQQEDEANALVGGVMDVAEPPEDDLTQDAFLDALHRATRLPGQAEPAPEG
jgi:hypothetical protein